ncbi:hypothetical protein KFK09_009165 [Dendrobium nobile]|uniref:Uncharacterized protein n=1 Tax=Dendrobium nobile TaxID=94219 RepID=A0A8T3BRW9_DENNO|nr:hypothetical protein KFK09_009165 [Dendrobium nobile]
MSAILTAIFPADRNKHISPLCVLIDPFSAHLFVIPSSHLLPALAAIRSSGN